MAYPNATLDEFTAGEPEKVGWADIDTVQITADFLAHPQDFLHDLLDDDSNP